MVPARIVSSLALVVGLTATSGLSALAQPTVRLADLPSSTLGGWSRLLVNGSGVPAPALIGSAGGPHSWNFAGPRSEEETEQRIDIVPPDDGQRGGDFPEAAYAERTTYLGSGQKSWKYYRLEEEQGRLYYGEDDPVHNPGHPVVKYNEPTVELPAVLRYGDTWQRTVEFTAQADAGTGTQDVPLMFTSSVSVDGYGTLTLPELGEVEVLRINELRVYDSYQPTIGTSVKLYYRNYAWYSPRFGEVARVSSGAELSGPPPPDFPLAKTVQRLLASSAPSAAPKPMPASGLAIARLHPRLQLSWPAVSGAKSYLVESSPDLGSPGPWPDRTNTTNTEVLLDPPAATRFFRLFSLQ